MEKHEEIKRHKERLDELSKLWLYHSEQINKLENDE